MVVCSRRISQTADLSKVSDKARGRVLTSSRDDIRCRLQRKKGTNFPDADPLLLLHTFDIPFLRLPHVQAERCRRDGKLVMLKSATLRSRPPPRRRTPAGNDCLSGLPFELFLLIVKYVIDNTSSKPFASVKSLSSCNKTIRAKCISAGLFQSLLVSLHRGAGTIVAVNHRLFIKTIPASTIRTLSITESIISNCPSDFARLLALLPYLRALRIKGRTFTGSSITSLPPLDCGRLISFNSLLYKTLSSHNNLQTLEQLEIIECSTTQILIDIIVAIRGYNRLVFRRSRVVDEPDLIDHTNCNVKIVEIHGTSFRYAKWMGQFLQRTRICATLEFLSLPATLYIGSVTASLHHNNLKIEDVFPKLRTLHFSWPSPATSYSIRHGLRCKVTFKTAVLRVNSFLRDTGLDHVFPFPLQPSKH